MPAPLRAWYSSRDIDSLAARNVLLSGRVSLEELNRLAEFLSECEGTVDVKFGFEARAGGWSALELVFITKLQVICQRCLGPMTLDIDGRIEFGVVTSESMQDQLPEGVEPIVIGEDRLSPMQLLEDELIISLPLVPKHDRDEQCDSASAVDDGEVAASLAET